MRTLLSLGARLGVTALSFPWQPPAAAPAGAQPPQSGLARRVPWTTSNVKGSPEPPPPYRTERAFPKLKFNEPLDLTYAPGTNRLFVAQRWGKIYSFVNNKDVDTADLALEFKGAKDSKGAAMK